MISFRTGLPRVAARLRQQEKENQPRGLLSGIRSKNKKRRRGRRGRREAEGGIDLWWKRMVESLKRPALDNVTRRVEEDSDSAPALAFGRFWYGDERDVQMAMAECPDC